MNLFEAISAATTFSGLACPKCNSHSYRKHGHCLGIQRYKCKDCGRSFKETVNTPLHWIHNKLKMVQYIETMVDQQTIRRAAGNINISVNTSFCWRHKLLASLKTGQVQPAQTPAGSCQINLPHSFKGKRNVPDKKFPPARTFLVSDARGIPCLQLLPPQCTAFEASKTLRKAVDHSSILVAAPSKLLTRAVHYLDCRAITNTDGKKKLISRATAVANKLSAWMVRFRGVATKYLQQY